LIIFVLSKSKQKIEDLEEVPSMNSIRRDFGLYELWENLHIQPNENNGIIL
jgi:hypothetical protein